MHDAPGRTLTLAIDSRLAAVAPAARAVRDFLIASGCDPLEAAQVELCVTEAANNAVRHAYGLQPGLAVEIMCHCRDDRVVLVVEDGGEPMKNPPRPRPPEFDPADIESLPEGGMGLFLISAIMDEVRYTVADGRNSMTMTRYAPAALHAARPSTDRSVPDGKSC
jgi:serine/threonine-protein kinase RsbW